LEDLSIRIDPVKPTKLESNLFSTSQGFVFLVAWSPPHPAMKFR